MNDRPGAYQRRQSGSGNGFPGFDVLSQAGRWDPVTAGLVASRLDPSAPLAFFIEVRDVRPPGGLQQRKKTGVRRVRDGMRSKRCATP